MLPLREEADPVALWRSGVDALTPGQVRDQLVHLGWPVLAIVPHDERDTQAPSRLSKGAGKRPAEKKWQELAEFDGPRVSRSKLAAWARAGDNLPGTGIPCGDIVGIDIDVADRALSAEIEALAREALGDTPFVREGRAPRCMLVYRAAEAIPKQALKSLDGSGDGIDVMGAGSQFVAFGIHPSTLRAYSWQRGSESPLSASPDLAPEIDADQIAAFLDRIRHILPLGKAGGSRGPGGSSATIVRDAEGLVVDGREAFLTRLVHRIGCQLHVEVGEITAESLSACAWTRFQAEARLVVDGREWSRSDVEFKAARWLDRVNRKVISIPTPRDDPAPPYLDNRRSVAEAEQATREVITEFLDRHAPAYRNAFGRYEIEHASNPLALPPKIENWIVRVEAGIGKTAEAVRSIAKARGLNVVYVVPTIDLGDEVAGRFRAQGISARVYRGRERRDPESPDGSTMCLNLDAVADARRAGAHSAFGAVCERRKPDGSVARCPLFEACGHIRQRSAIPDIWITAATSLFIRRPKFIPAPHAIVIDEAFHGAALPARAAAITVDAIEAAGIPPHSDEAAELQGIRTLLVRALRSSADGPLTLAHLKAAGLTTQNVQRAKALEWRRWQEPEIYPDTSPAERRRIATEWEGKSREVKALAGLWAEIGEMLSNDWEASGRLRVKMDAETKARTLYRRSPRPIGEGWRAPTLLLDATAPPPSVIEPILGEAVSVKADITARWSAMGHVRQIVDAPVSATKLGLRQKDVEKRSITDLRRLIGIRAALSTPRQVLVIAQKEAVERISAAPLPSNVVFAHFNALAGLDRFKKAAGVIVVGRSLPEPRAMESDAGVITGKASNAVEAWYPQETAFIRLADGSATPVHRHAHPDEVAEALSRQACEGQLVQAVGRIRPLRRADCFFVDIIGDVPLPIVVDEVTTWENAKMGPWADQAVNGVVLASRSDIATVMGVSEDRARGMAAGFPGETSIEKNPIEKTPGNRPSRRAAYKVYGRGKKRVEAIILPNGPMGEIAFREQLAAQLGEIDEVEVERITVDPEMFARLGRRLALTLDVGSLSTGVVRATRAATHQIETVSIMLARAEPIAIEGIDDI
jgi:hypothetical protein